MPKPACKWTIAIDGSKFKAVNSRDKNFTHPILKIVLKKIEENISRYLLDMDVADRASDRLGENTTWKTGKPSLTFDMA